MHGMFSPFWSRALRNAEGQQRICSQNSNALTPVLSDGILTEYWHNFVKRKENIAGLKLGFLTALSNQANMYEGNCAHKPSQARLNARRSSPLLSSGASLVWQLLRAHADLVGSSP